MQNNRCDGVLATTAAAAASLAELTTAEAEVGGVALPLSLPAVDVQDVVVRRLVVANIYQSTIIPVSAGATHANS